MAGTEKTEEDDLSTLPFMDSSLDLEERVEDLLNRLTLQEKFKLSSGRLMWYTKPIRRLGVKSFAMYDGPHGVRPDIQGERTCTYFPSGICRAASWDVKLSREFGKAIAEEVRELGGHMILAPGINIHRTPMCGRTFEYQTEDPYLNKSLVVNVVKGVQSQRIAACVKHFICNNQETNRFTVSSEVSERALQEIYLPAFRAAVEEADAWSIMSCYNKVNGTYGSENYNLLRERLMGEWGFRGFVVSDWNATAFTKTENCVNAGLSLEMPTAKNYKKNLMLQLYEEGKFTIDALDDNIKRLLRVMFLVGMFDDKTTLPIGSRNTTEHQILARKIAEDGIVLLKNDNNLLPLDLDSLGKIAAVGPNADKKTSIGGGSSQNFPPYEVTPLEALKDKVNGRIQITDLVPEADVVIVFAGLNHKRGVDSEGVDKESFIFPVDQVNLINETVKQNPKTVVVLTNGSPVAMQEWLDNIPSVIEAWYGGMEAGNAIIDVLFGDVNPSGKLPLTFPNALKDSPAHISKRTYPGNEKVFYDEGIFVGYRHFDKMNNEPLFPFGYGMSYTTFAFEDLKVSQSKISQNEKFTVSVNITNTGEREGAEVVQLYIQDIETSIERPPKELKGFKKVNLKPGEKTPISFELGTEDLAFYDDRLNEWRAEKGRFNILIGSSSRDIYLEGKMELLD